MQRFRPQIPGAVTLAVLALGLGSMAQPKGMRTRTIVIENMKFNPAVLPVQAGDTVEFRNADLVPHNVTARDRSFDSGMIKPNEVWTFTAKQKGAFSFQCIYHPDMTGRIQVGDTAETSVGDWPTGVELCKSQ